MRDSSGKKWDRLEADPDYQARLRPDPNGKGLYDWINERGYVLKKSAEWSAWLAKNFHSIKANHREELAAMIDDAQTVKDILQIRSFVLNGFKKGE